MMRASDTLADSRVQKPKNFLAFFLRLLPPPLRRQAEKEMERKFLVLLRRFRLQNEHLYYIICGSLELFISPSSRRPRRFLSAFGGSLGFCSSDFWSWYLSKRIVLGTNKSVCACPPRPARAQIPAVLKKHYKTAGIAPLIIISNLYSFLNGI